MHKIIATIVAAVALTIPVAPGHGHSDDSGNGGVTTQRAIDWD